MHNILLEIIEKKRKDLEKQKKKISSEEMKKKAFLNKRSTLFKKNILNALDTAVIAEIKLSSPTIPFLGSEKEILQRAGEYEKAGANAVSFITEDHYFKGKTKFIAQLKKTVSLPVLQKDFVIDEYQIYEAKKIGSDALLLISRIIDKKLLHKFVNLCLEIGLEPIVEINDKKDLKKAVLTKTDFIAVNARDLRDFNIDVDKACDIMRLIPDKFIKLGFSGIHSSQDVKKYKKAGAKGVLVGTELMRAKNIKKFIENLNS